MTPHRIPIQAKTPLRTIGKMIDKLEVDTEKVRKELVKDKPEHGIVFGLAVSIAVWVAIAIVVLALKYALG